MLGMYLAMLETEEEKSQFEQIYLANKNVMFHFAYRILQDDFLAEDAVHEAFLILTNNMKKISDRNCIQTRNFMITTVKNVSLKIYNKRKKDKLSENLGDIYDSFFNSEIEIDIENLEEQEKLFALIKTLDEKYSDVLILKYFYDMKDKEIANALGISLQNSKIRLHRAKEMLKNKVTEENFYDEQTV